MQIKNAIDVITRTLIFFQLLYKLENINPKENKDPTARQKYFGRLIGSRLIQGVTAMLTSARVTRTEFCTFKLTALADTKAEYCNYP
jgi:hypothetical protein